MRSEESREPDAHGEAQRGLASLPPAEPNRRQGYERGMVVAPQSHSDDAAGSREDGFSARDGQSAHETPLAGSSAFSPSQPCRGRPAAQDVGHTGFNLPGDHPGTVTTKKDCAPQLSLGQGLVNGGLYLFQRLLEVVPLCSQPTGKRDCRSVFPLPTSKSVLLEVDGSLTDLELCWTMCVTLSLNSIWRSEAFSEQPVNVAQRNCLLNIFKDVKRFCQIDARVEDFLGMIFS